MIGGEVYNALTPVYEAEPYSHRLVVNFATVPGFIRRDVLVPPHTTLKVSAAFRMPVVMTPLPQIWVYERTARPTLIDPYGSDSVDATAQATQSVANQWEAVDCYLTNDSDDFKEYRVLIGGTGAGTMYVSQPSYTFINPFDPVAAGDTETLTLYRGKTTTLQWHLDTDRDLSGANAVRFQFGVSSYPCVVSGEAADWTITITDFLTPTTLFPMRYSGELAFYSGSVEGAMLKALTVIVNNNPGLEYD